MAVSSWIELVIFVVVTALVIVFIWHFPKNASPQITACQSSLIFLAN